MADIFKHEAVSSSQPDSESSNGPEKGEMSPKDEETTQEAGSENVLVIDTSFTCKIVAPGLDPFEIKVSSEEIVQEVRNTLMDNEDLCTRTCFSLQHDGQVLDQYAELKNISGLKEGSVIKLVEEPYTVREARFHVKRIKEILTSCDQTDAFNGHNFASLSYVNAVWSGDGSGNSGSNANGSSAGAAGDKRRAKPESMDCTPPDYIMPGSKERPLLPLHPNFAELKAPQCVKILTYDGWNPPPGQRKLHGDLLYLFIVTLEDKEFHATASSRGFYVNQSTKEEFNPRAATAFKALHHSLVDLLAMISPGFKRNWSLLVKKRYSKHPYERMFTPYQVYSWMAPQQEHTMDLVRMEDGLMTGRLGYEDTLPTGSRDWNEEFQIVKELPKKTLPERVDRERSMFKVNSDFVWAATRGAQLVVEGCLMAINPGEESKIQMFIWNNIFFSMGFDVKDHYKDFGGDDAAYVAPAKDLQGVKAYSELDIDGLCVLGTVVVDYQGYRITAQSIIPGILEREQEQSVVYGSIDFGKTVVTNDKYKDVLEKAAAALKIRPHKVINHKGETIELYSAVDCKGIIGTDNRKYVLDLLRTFPPDVNYLKSECVELSEELVKGGYPLEFRHKFVTLRQELVDAFFELRYLAFVKHAAVLFERERLQQKAELTEGKVPALVDSADAKISQETIEESEKAVSANGAAPAPDLPTEEAKKAYEDLIHKEKQAEGSDPVAENILKQAAEVVGSLSEKEFHIAFNPDLYQPRVVHSSDDESVKRLQQDKAMLVKAAELLVFHQIPTFVQQCLDHSMAPVDGRTLTEALHARGINIRYLGKVTEVVAQYPQLSYLHALCISEMICRSTKFLFQQHMHNVDPMNLSSAVSHFLNCLLSSHPTPHVAFEEQHSRTSKKKQKKKERSSAFNTKDNTEWVAETPKSLWSKIVDDVKKHFNLTLECDSVDTAAERYGFQKVSLLRIFCQRVGLQILLREYNLDNRHRQAFFEEDIINTFPVVKHVMPRASDAYRFFTSGQEKIQRGQFQEGYELIVEALNLLNVYGPMHAEIAACCRLLARLNYLMGDYAEALSFQQKATIMNERCLGVDHPNTITDYMHLAIYSFASSQVSGALQLLYRARYLLLLNFGERHPDVALLDMNIGLVLHGVGEYELSLHFMENAKELFKVFFGDKSLKVATAFHLMAKTHVSRGEFRSALLHEKEAYAIYKLKLGETHEKTRESSDRLKHLTQQAVLYQKKINELGKSDKGAVNLPALQAVLHSIQVPSLKSILDTLNVINGIAVPIQISAQDVSRLHDEMTAAAAAAAAIGDASSASSACASDAAGDAIRALSSGSGLTAEEVD